MPTGIYDCDLTEIEARYAYNKQRRAVWDTFRNYLSQLTAIPEIDVIYVDGSFTTDKESYYSNDAPGDVDIVLEFPDLATINILWLNHRTGLLNHDDVKAQFKTDIWLVDVAGRPMDLRKFFTYIRPEDAVARGLSVGTEKGILRISLKDEWRNGTI